MRGVGVGGKTWGGGGDGAGAPGVGDEMMGVAVGMVEVTWGVKRGKITGVGADVGKVRVDLERLHVHPPTPRRSRKIKKIKRKTRLDNKLMGYRPSAIFETGGWTIEDGRCLVA